MASIFDSQLQSQAKNEATILSPVSDPSASVRFENLLSVGKTAVDAGVAINNRIARNNLTGDEAAATEELSNFQDSLESGASTKEARQQIKTLAGLAQVRRAMPDKFSASEAETRAQVLVKEAASANPLAADSIRQASRIFFGGAGGGTSSVFKPTAFEKAQEAFSQKVNEEAMLKGVSFEKARQDISERQIRQDRLTELEEIERTRRLQGVEVLGKSELRLTGVIQGLNDQVLNLTNGAQATGAGLSADQVVSLKRGTKVAADRLREDLRLDATRNGSFGTNAYNDALANISKWEKGYNAFLEDQSAQKLAASKSEEMKSLHQQKMYEHFPVFLAMKDLGLQDLSLEIARGNDEFIRMSEAHPATRKFLKSLDNFEKGVADLGYAGKAALFGGEESFDPDVYDQTAPLGTAAVMSDRNGPKMLSKAIEADMSRVMDSTKTMVGQMPDSILLFNRSDYQNVIKAEPEKYRPVIENMLKAVADREKGRAVQASGSLNFNLKITPDVATRPQSSFLPGSIPVQGAVTVSGTNIDDLTKQRVTEMLKVAEKNPYLWDGQHESAIDYVQSYFTFDQTQPQAPVQAPVEQPTTTPQQEQVEDTTVQETDSLSFNTSENTISTKDGAVKDINLEPFFVFPGAQQSILELGRPVTAADALDVIIANGGKDPFTGESIGTRDFEAPDKSSKLKKFIKNAENLRRKVRDEGLILPKVDDIGEENLPINSSDFKRLREDLIELSNLARQAELERDPQKKKRFLEEKKELEKAFKEFKSQGKRRTTQNPLR